MEYVAAGYMTRFQCLGGACEDTCCKAWDVMVTESDLQRLSGALGAAAQDLATRIPNGRGGTVTVLKKLPDRACLELDPTGLCKVHAAHGEAALPDVCMSYPRVIGRLDDRLELTGRMSCPEVARLSLLADDPLLTPSPREPFGREIGRLRLSRDGAPYFAAFETVRDAIIALVVDPTHPFQSRLYFIAELATRLAPFYHREATAIDARLDETIAEVRAQAAELHAKRIASSPMNGLALQSVFSMLGARGDAAPAFAAVVKKTAETYAPGSPLPPVDALMAAGPEHLWMSHIARRPKPGTPHGLRLDRYLARAARHYWLQDWYPVSETLFEHLMHLVLRNALVRFLLLGHPEFGETLDDASCDRAAVEVIYACARAYDHNPEVREALSYTLASRGMLTVEHCAAMLKL